jgi:cytochrome c oxidase assembly factor CtaG
MLIVVASPLAHLDHHLLTAHMAQHLLLMLVAAPLILFGARSIVGQWSPPLTLCWLAGAVTVLAWHVPVIFELALQSQSWHKFEHASFFLAGILFWWPVVQPAPYARWSIPIYLFLATLPCDALSAFLAFCGHVVYRPYLSGASGLLGLSPLDDQALAGALMWVTVTFAYLIPALLLTARLLSNERKSAADVLVS